MMRVKLLFAALCLSVPMLANAAHCGNQCDNNSDESAGDETSFQDYTYLGVKAGSGQVKSNGNTGASNSYGATYGYRPTKMFGVEMEYTYLGAYRDAVSAGHATAVSLAGLHYLNMTDNLALIGKLGIAYTTTQNYPSQGGTSTNFVYGLGLDWQASCDVGIRLEIDKYNLKMPANTTATNAYLGFNFSY